MGKSRIGFVVNSLLLAFGAAMVVSGFVIQFGYHVGRMPLKADIWGISHSVWCGAHKWVAIGFAVLVVWHVWLHWKWFRGVIAKKLFRRNRHTVILTLLIITVSILGFLPWLIGVFQGSTHIRYDMIEIHDKAAIVLSVYLILHFYKRAGRYLKS